MCQDEKGLDADVEDTKLKLQSAESELFEVDKKVALQSELVKTMVEGGMCGATLF